MQRTIVVICLFFLGFVLYVQSTPDTFESLYLKMTIYNELPAAVKDHFDALRLFQEFKKRIDDWHENRNMNQIDLDLKISFEDNTIVFGFFENHFVPFETEKEWDPTNYFISSSSGGKPHLNTHYQYKFRASWVYQWFVYSIWEMDNMKLQEALLSKPAQCFYKLSKDTGEYLVVFMNLFWEEGLLGGPHIYIVSPIIIFNPEWGEYNVPLRGGEGWSRELYEFGKYVLDDPIDPITDQKQSSYLVYLFFDKGYSVDAEN